MEEREKEQKITLKKQGAEEGMFSISQENEPLLENSIPNNAGAGNGGHQVPGNHRGLLIGICAALLLIVIGVVCFASGFFQKDPKKVVQQALLDTVMETKKAAPALLEQAGVSQVMERLAEQPIEQSGSFMITEIPAAFKQYQQLLKYGIQFTSQTDYQAKKCNVDISAQYNGTGIFGMNFFTDNEEIQLGVPALFDGLLSFQVNSFITDYNNSYFGSYGKLQEGEVTLRLFPTEEQKRADLDKTDTFLTGMLEATAQSRQAIYDNMVVVKEEEFPYSNLLAEENPEGGSGYQITLPAADIRTYFDALSAYLKEDATVREVLLAASASQLAMRYGEAAQADILSSAYENMDQIFELCKALFQEDVSIHCYINDKGLMTTAGGTLTFPEEQGGADCDIVLQLTGEENLIDSFTLAAETMYGKMQVQKAAGLENDNQYQSAYRLSIQEGDEESALSLDTAYQKDTGDFTTVFEIKDSETQTSVTMSAKGALITNAEMGTILLEIPELKCNAIANGQEVTVGLQAEYRMRPADEVTPLTGEEYEILKMSEEELNAFVQEVYGNLIRLIMSFSS